MRIIDSNKDYYDYLQNIYRDNTLVFDRRNSYNLSKKEFCGWFYGENAQWHSKIHYIVLQVCNTFWLFKMTVTKENDFGRCEDYVLELIGSWKDYNKPTELIKLLRISFRYFVKDSADNRIEAVKNGDYKIEKIFDSFIKNDIIKGKYVETVKTIPILQNIGIASLVEPLEIYLALEEYFGKQKSINERTESIGLSNDEKITNHGFNIKNSFRGV